MPVWLEARGGCAHVQACLAWVGWRRVVEWWWVLVCWISRSNVGCMCVDEVGRKLGAGMWVAQRECRHTARTTVHLPPGHAQLVWTCAWMPCAPYTCPLPPSQHTRTQTCRVRACSVCAHTHTTRTPPQPYRGEGSAPQLLVAPICVAAEVNGVPGDDARLLRTGVRTGVGHSYHGSQALFGEGTGYCMAGAQGEQASYTPAGGHWRGRRGVAARGCSCSPALARLSLRRQRACTS